MIYSEDINKICAVCVHAKAIKGSDTHMDCSMRGECVPLAKEACEKFSYDIFKRHTRRRKKSTDTFKPEDFIL